MLRTIALFAITFITAAQGAEPRDTVPFDAGWRFMRGDVAGAEQAAATDEQWQLVDLPHDWAIAGPFDEHAAAGGAGGFLPSGVAWYRKHFNLPAADAKRRVFVEFDGVMDKSGVWINGMHLGHLPNGYASFRYELTPHLRFGAGASNANVIAVRADTQAQPASRWYAGSGIYRHVRLISTGDVHIEQSGSFVTTPQIGANSATVRVAASVLNQSTLDGAAHMTVTILTPDGKRLATANGVAAPLPAGRTATLSVEATVPNPRRWDVADPALHRALIEIVARDGRVIDTDSVTFGIREARFEAASGFWLNGRNLKLKGVAVHADAGALGMAAPLAFWERRLKGLQALGVNSIRTAHHPFSPEVLDLCDRLGIIVMDEAFDMWTVAKNPFDYHLYFTDWSSIDLRDFVRRDRNHPSVVIWSAGNEIHDTPYPLIAKSILRRLLDVFHENDPSRPVTMALFRPNTTNDYNNGLADMLDVVGQNYRENELAAAHKQNPQRKVIGTENGKGRSNWLIVRDHPAIAGMYLWVGADYLGEADRAGWPVTSASSGIVDRIDQPKEEGLERASWWSEKPVVHVARRLVQPIDTSALPTAAAVAAPAPAGPVAAADWTPANLAPHEETVEVYSNAEEVELLMNERTLGRLKRNADDAPRVWKAQFAPGRVRAVGYNGGKKVAEEALVTAGRPAQLRLVAEQKSLAQGFDHVGFVRVEVADAEGTLVPDGANAVRLKVEGPGVLAAFDNADVRDHTPFAAAERKLFKGRALAMLRATAASGVIRVSASAEGLRGAGVALTVVAP
jgi:beta-galactosidase